MKNVDAYRLLENFGLPLTILAVVAWGTKKAAATVWVDLVIPFRDKGLIRIEKFIDKLDAALDATMERHLKNEHDGQRHEDLSWRIYNEVEGVRDRCDRIIERMGMQAQSQMPQRQQQQRRRRPPHQPTDPLASPPHHPAPPPPPPGPGGSTTSPPI